MYLLAAILYDNDKLWYVVSPSQKDWWGKKGLDWIYWEAKTFYGGNEMLTEMPKEINSYYWAAILQAVEKHTGSCQAQWQAFQIQKSHVLFL